MAHESRSKSRTTATPGTRQRKPRTTTSLIGPVTFARTSERARNAEPTIAIGVIASGAERMAAEVAWLLIAAVVEPLAGDRFVGAVSSVRPGRLEASPHP